MTGYKKCIEWRFQIQDNWYSIGQTRLENGESIAVVEQLLKDEQEDSRRSEEIVFVNGEWMFRYGEGDFATYDQRVAFSQDGILEYLNLNPLPDDAFD